MHSLKQKEVSLKSKAGVHAVPMKGDQQVFHRWKSGYQGVNQKATPDAGWEYRLDDPVIKGMQYVEWDGVTPKAIADPDCDGRVLVVLAGAPREGWDEVCQGASEAMLTAGKKFNCSDKKKAHRWGVFPVATTGISYGGGRKVSHIFSIAVNWY
ncbi:hypothetical protein GLOTRDRAFT_93260 [Gloeophyllum trabeum ATCC 11539]|uniref:Uncharacterized protein n=1 Tax=Gloeophyllum trabeum (strain ATCC 11539 / FP-39264 / Madison 617) TaxID=670483 RepID=S7Q828_GLOTA|nr:uncharacterized protein GLOTRDRAFT_93260 [Gloeophyllum trabeum ATCC 11539]EPQ55682.1 hypothetical protein GLOTRDRAFT_93260 [Gloeophyllum trabeum ATCC 11539]